MIRSATLPVGRRYLLQLPVGLYGELLQKSSLELAAALGVREVRVKVSPVNARYVEFAVIRSSAFPKVLASPLVTCARVSLWEPIFLGVGNDGLAVPLTLPEHNLLDWRRTRVGKVRSPLNHRGRCRSRSHGPPHAARR